MKKIIVLLIAVMMVVSVMTGCMPTVDVTPKEDEQNSVVSNDAGEQAENEVEEPTEAPETEKVILEQNGIKITYKGISTGWIGKEVNLKVENNSDKNYTVQVRNVSVNGYMIDGIFSCQVNSGKAANDEISFLNSDFEDNDIESIEELEFNFHIFNDDDWMDSFDSDTIIINP